MRAERMQILRMLEEGKITADEAVKLLDSIEEGDEARGVARTRRTLRVRLIEGGETRVNVAVPVGLAKAALKVASIVDERFGAVDVDEILGEISRGAEGPLVEVEREKEKVVVSVE